MISPAPNGIAYDRAGPRGGQTVVLIHAGVADRRMWEGQWSGLTAEHDVVRLDLRGFGESTARPPGALSPHDDVLECLTYLGVERADLVGASYGAGVAVEVALTRPELVGSLVLVAPGGSLIAEMMPSLQVFVDAERAALESGDVEAGVEANMACWVDGRRDVDAVDPRVREAVAMMQRRAFEVSMQWDDVEEVEVDPPALERLGEIGVPTLVLVGEYDLDAIHDAAARVVTGIGGARRVDWPDVAHLPSMERPERFLDLLQRWLVEQASSV